MLRALWLQHMRKGKLDNQDFKSAQCENWDPSPLLRPDRMRQRK